jgi:surface polysaccharide O-acyltransferase-like enzyme
LSQSPAAGWRLGPVSGPIDPDVSSRIDVLRIILIGLIVLCHGGRFVGSDIPFAGTTVEFLLTFVNRGLDCVAVPLFFCISGYLLLRKLELSPAAYASLIRKKAVSIGVPFLVFNGIWIIWIFAVGSIVMFGSRSFLLQTGIVHKLLGIGTSPINYPLWFLRDLLLIFAVSPVFLVFYKRLPVTGLSLLLLLWFVESPASEYSLAGFAFAFYLGGFLARRGVNLRDTAGWDKYVFPVFLLGSVVVGLQPWIGLDPYSLAALKKVYQMVGVVAFWCLSRRQWVQGPALLHRMASHSFFIFLTHEPTVSLLQSRLQLLWQPTGTVSQLLGYFVPGLAALFLLYGLACLLSRLVPGVYAVLSGAPLRRRAAKVPA